MNEPGIEERCQGTAAESGRIYLLPLWVRLWHWTNAALILILGVTGISLHFADNGLPLVEFSLSVRMHNLAGMALVALYIFFVIANALTGNWWQFVPKPPGIFERCIKQLRFYAWGVFRGEREPYPATPAAHFNALQAITYWVMIYLVMPVIVVTGLIFLNPQWAPVEMFGMDGLLPIAMAHYIAATIVLTFLVAHVYLCTFGKKLGSTFITMITGWHEH